MVAVYVAFLLVPGFIISGDWKQYLIAGIVLGLLNMVVRPVLKLVSLPLILLTLGMFTFFINILILWVFDYLMPSVTIEGLMAMIWTTIIVSIVNIFFSTITKLA